MADKNFRVRHGLEVDGDATLSGDLQVSGNDIKSSTGATAITLSGSDVAIAGDLTVSGNDIKSSGGTTAITLSGANVTVAGDLTVSGTTTTLDTQNLLVEDNSILLNKNEAGAGVTAGTAGIEIERGSLANVEFRWNESNDRWQTTVDGSTYISLPNQSLDTTSSPTFADLTLSGDLAVNGGDITTTSTTANIVNTTATTVNIAGAGTAVNIGAGTGTTTVNNNLDVDGNLVVNADQTVTTPSFTMYNGTSPATLAYDGTHLRSNQNINVNDKTFLYTGGDVRIGNDVYVGGDSITLNEQQTSPGNNANIWVERGSSADVQLLWNEGTDRWQFTNDGTNYYNLLVPTDDPTFDDLTLSGDLAVNGGDITTNQTTFNLINTTATTLNIGGGATTAVVIGNSAGEIDTPSDIQIIGNKSLRQGDGPYSGSTDIFRSNLNAALEGVQISNSGMTAAESTLVIRNYGQNYSGGSTTTQGTGNIYFGGTRGTPASPLATNNGGVISYLGTITNYGDTTGAGTGNGWSNDLYPNTAQASSTYIQAIQDHRRTAQATFTASQAGSTLTVTAVTSGTIVPGHELRRSGSVSYSVVIVRQITSTAAGNALGSTGTYQVSAASSFASQTCTTNTVSSGTQAIFSLMPTTINGTTLNAVPTAANAQNINYIPNADGGNEIHNYRLFTIQPNWNYYPVATRIITEITGGNTLNIGTHNFTTPGASFTVTTAGNPNGLTTNTTYFIDTIPSSTTITLRTNSVGTSIPVTGLTNGSNLFISAQAAAQSYTGDRLGSALILYGTRRGNNYTGATAPGSNNTYDVNRANDSLGSILFSGFRTTTGTIAQSTAIAGRCTEDWTSATNIGSEILINTVKTGTGTTYSTNIGANSTTFITDSFNVTSTAGSSMVTVNSSGNLTIAGDLRVNGNDILNSAGTTAIGMSNAATNALLLNSTAASMTADVIRYFHSNANGLSNIQFNPGNAQGATNGDRQNGFALFMRRNPAQTTERPQVALNNWIQDPSTLTYSANQSGEVLGVFQFAGQYSTTGTPLSGGPSVEFGARAAENFTATANGGRAIIMVDKIGTTTSYDAVAIDSDNAFIRSNTITLQDNNSNNLAILDSSGNLRLIGDLRVDGGDIQNPGGTSAITLTSSNTATTIRGDTINLNNAAGATLQLTNATESRYRSARHVFGQVVGGATIFDITDTGSGTTGVSSVYSNPYQTSTTGINQTSVFSSDTTSTLQISGVSSTGSTVSTVNLQSYRRSAGNNAATQTNDRLGQLTFNGNTNTGTGSPTTPVVGGEIRFYATENWTGSATGSGVALEVVKQGTTTNTNVFLNDGLNTEIRGDQITFDNMAGTALTSANVNYTRTYGEFAYANAAGFAIAAQNTIYEMPLDTTLVNSGVTISNTSRININVSGFYKIFMSLQSTLTVTNQPAQFDFWLRKNGVDVANSKTQVDLLKDQKTVTSMHWLVESDGNDYWEIVYVGTTANYADIDFPTIAATTTPYVSPVAPALLVNVIPVGM